MNQVKRVDWVDTVKGVAILLVVLRHVTGGLRTAGLIEAQGTLHLLDGWVYYSFSVAAFFFVGGLFIYRSCMKKTLADFTMDRVRTLVYPYFVWSLLTYAFAFIFEDYTNHSSLGQGSEILYRLFVDPENRFWFLYGFFLVLVLFATMMKRNFKPVHFLFLSVGIFALNMWLEFDLYNGMLYDTSLNMIFFALGVTYSEPILRYLDDAGDRRLSILGVYFILAWFIMVFTYRGTEILVIEFMGQLVGLIGLVSLSELFIRIPATTFLHTLGQYSFEIYLTHGFVIAAIRIFLVRFLGVTNTWVDVLISVMVGVLVPMLFAKVVEHFKIPYVFNFPKPSASAPDAPAIPHR
ncbi:MAG: acyltransferase family protein [Phototrophicaceae bacterium]